ncbi:MAG: biotin--[acetyl-CoA-carboxylase] ligase, partial [Candidatus Omnitrophica bacterium]|nr:biotin--[acetyl-CoA-carboxylase] ligase [Candidatus Omnitrophota bacterium]
VNSTMDIAFDLGLKNTPEGTLFLAEAQTKGRGRLGRTWSSPKYKGIYMSLILKPKIPPYQASLLTLVSAVAVAEAIENLTGLSVQIKWPNDILINQKKLGGILTELNAEMDQIHFAVIGIGINVNNDKKNLIAGATSLREQKKERINRVELLKEILFRLEENYLLWKDKGSSAIIKKWHLYDITLGKRIKIFLHKGTLEGQALDIDLDGSLLVRDDTGLIHKITAGDVVHCR